MALPSWLSSCLLSFWFPPAGTSPPPGRFYIFTAFFHVFGADFMFPWRILCFRCVFHVFTIFLLTVLFSQNTAEAQKRLFTVVEQTHKQFLGNLKRNSRSSPCPKFLPLPQSLTGDLIQTPAEPYPKTLLDGIHEVWKTQRLRKSSFSLGQSGRHGKAGRGTPNPAKRRTFGRQNPCGQWWPQLAPATGQGKPSPSPGAILGGVGTTGGHRSGCHVNAPENAKFRVMNPCKERPLHPDRLSRLPL